MMMDRRSLLLAAVSSAGTAASGVLAAEVPDAVQPLWPGTPPGGGGPSGPPQLSHAGAVTNVAMPRLEMFRPARPNGAAMLIAAGGGYKRIERGMEALPAAQWLTARGVTAFVLTYRLPPEGWRDGPLAPLQDAQRALRLIRAMASKERIDPERIGLFGFSAGGHLAGMAATRSGFRSYDPVDAADDLPARADALVLAYPVITLMPPYDHTSTRRSLIGAHPTRSQSAEWSVETHVRSGCPPVFVVQAADDPVSNPANSAILQQACQRAGVPVERRLLPSGGHGFGMGRPGTPTNAWPQALQTWLEAARLI